MDSFGSFGNYDDSSVSAENLGRRNYICIFISKELITRLELLTF